MTHVTCRLTAKNRDQLRNPTLGNRVWATFLLLRPRTLTFKRGLTFLRRTNLPNIRVKRIFQKHTERHTYTEPIVLPDDYGGRENGC